MVEHNLAKVGVESSNLFARSIFETIAKGGPRAALCRFRARSGQIEVLLSPYNPLIPANAGTHFVKLGEA